MDFLTCLSVAQRISRTMPTWTILSLGRFLPPEEITRESPWGISVIVRGATKPRVIWTEGELQEVIDESFGGPCVDASAPAGMLF